MGADSDSISSARHWKEYTSFVAPIDLVAAGGGACRRIVIVAGSGTITMVSQWGTPQDTLTVAAGDVLEVQAKEITSVTGVTRVAVYW